MKIKKSLLRKGIGKYYREYMKHPSESEFDRLVDLTILLVKAKLEKIQPYNVEILPSVTQTDVENLTLLLVMKFFTIEEYIDNLNFNIFLTDNEGFVQTKASLKEILE